MCEREDISRGDTFSYSVLLLFANKIAGDLGDLF